MGTPGSWNLNDGDLDDKKFEIGDGRSFTYDIEGPIDENILKSKSIDDATMKAYESYKSMGGREAYSYFKSKLSQSDGKLHYLGEYKSGNHPQNNLGGKAERVNAPSRLCALGSSKLNSLKITIQQLI